LAERVRVTGLTPKRGVCLKAIKADDQAPYRREKRRGGRFATLGGQKTVCA